MRALAAALFFACLYAPAWAQTAAAPPMASPAVVVDRAGAAKQAEMIQDRAKWSLRRREAVQQKIRPWRRTKYIRECMAL